MSVHVSMCVYLCVCINAGACGCQRHWILLELQATVKLSTRVLGIDLRSSARAIYTLTTKAQFLLFSWFFLFFLKIYLLFHDMSVLSACLSAHYRLGFFRGQKRASYPLELPQMVVITMWIKGIEPRFSGRAVNAFNHQEDSPAHN